MCQLAGRILEVRSRCPKDELMSARRDRARYWVSAEGGHA
jgi:hypothetical protein